MADELGEAGVGAIISQIKALRAAGPNLSRDAFLEAMGALGTLDLGSTTLTFGPGDKQGKDRVFLTRTAPGGSFEPL